LMIPATVNEINVIGHAELIVAYIEGNDHT